MDNARQYWLDTMLRISLPVIEAAAEERLHRDMPCECRVEDEVQVNIRRRFTHLEAVGRTVDGISAWISCKGLSGKEEEERKRTADLTRKAIIHITNPESPDFVNFGSGRQPLVDAAFLAHGILRAQEELLDPLSSEEKKLLAACMRASCCIKSGFNNFYMFLAMIETLLYVMGEPYDKNPY